MKNKQIIGIIVAAVVFVFVCGSSILVNSLAGNAFSSNIESLENATGLSDLPSEPYVGVITISGVIQDIGSSTMFETVQYDHQMTLNLIEDYMNSDSNRGILLDLSTPGGAAYECDEVYMKLKEYKEVTGRPIWAYARKQACSAGYYIAMTADEFCANRNSWVGSIGSIISILDYSKFSEEIGIKEVCITSGDNKTFGGSNGVSDEQRAFLQSIIDEDYELFLEVVSEGRNMPVSKIKPLADGRFFTAKQAKEHGLIDSIDTYDNFCASIAEQLGEEEIEFYSYSSYESVWTSFMSTLPKRSRSDLEILSEMMEKQGSGVPMYYANTGK